MLLRRNIRCTVICVINAKYEINNICVIKAKYKMHSYLCHEGKIYFWDAVICVIKAKYEVSKIYVIKAKYKILVIGNLWLFLYAQLFCFITFLCFWDAVTYFKITRCHCLVFKYDRELKTLVLQNEPPTKERVGFFPKYFWREQKV